MAGEGQSRLGGAPASLSASLTISCEILTSDALLASEQSRTSVVFSIASKLILCVGSLFSSPKHAIRWMLQETGTDYVENLIRTKADMSSLRGTGKLMYNQVPMLEIDGLTIVQTDAALRYLARKHNMLGADLHEGAKVDMVHAATNDIRGSVLGLPFTTPPQRALMLDQCLQVTLPKYLMPIEKLLQGSATCFIAGGGGMTLADVTLCEAVCMIVDAPQVAHRTLEHLQGRYPCVYKHMQMVLARPGIAQYSSSGRRRIFSCEQTLDKYAAEVRAALA
jgi:glutathione S-transferase